MSEQTASQLTASAVIALDEATAAIADSPAAGATDAIERAVELLERIQDAATSEVREGLAARLQEMTTKAGRQNLIECHTDPKFAPTPEFLAGLRFAAELVADHQFDY